MELCGNFIFNTSSIILFCEQNNMYKKRFTSGKTASKPQPQRLQLLLSQANRQAGLSALITKLDSRYLLDAQIVTFRQISNAKLQFFAALINGSERLKYSIKNTFYEKGKSIIKFLLNSCLEQDSGSIEIWRGLCVFFSSYHLKNYNIDESMVRILIKEAGCLQNEQKARLALNCLADLLMKLPQFSGLAFEFLYQNFIYLTDYQNMKRMFGYKLFFSVLRSMFYCVISDDLQLEKKTILSIFLGIKRVLLLDSGDTAEDNYFMSKARAFGLQILQTLYKAHAKFLYPFLGHYFKKDGLCNLLKWESDNNAVVARTITVILESTPFTQFQLHKDQANTSTLYCLSRRIMKTIFKVLCNILKIQKDEESVSTYLKLASAFFKCPLTISSSKKTMKLIEKINKIYSRSTLYLQKQCLISLVPAFCSCREEVFQGLNENDLNFYVINDEMLSLKLGLVKELAKISLPKSIIDRLVDLSDHEDYRVKNNVFEILNIFAKTDASVACAIFDKLKNYIKQGNAEGIIPSLNALDVCSVGFLKEIEPQCEEMFQIISSSNNLLVSKILRFLSITLRLEILSDGLKQQFMGKMLDLSSTTNMMILQGLSLALSNISSVKSMEFYLDQIMILVRTISLHQKSGLHSNVMISLSNLIENFSSQLLLPYVSEIVDITLNAIDFNKTNVSLLACSTLTGLIDKRDLLSINLHNIMDKLLNILSTHENYRTKIEICGPISKLIAPCNYVTIMKAMLKELEKERVLLYSDIYLSMNQAKYKQELFFIMLDVLMLKDIEISDIEKFLIENLPNILKWINLYIQDGGQRPVNEVSSKLLGWLEASLSIPISFNSYNRLEKIEKGEYDEVMMTASEELDFALDLLV